MNIKLGSVVSDVLGVSARDMLDAIAGGEEDPEKLANFRSTHHEKEERRNGTRLKGYINLKTAIFRSFI
ncbi:hypothetical protein [Bacillus sp. M6-12]|uniref:hypothetical protein n=1 Tax=Bacillus sp. M6-12 TaxID=2054166 RepID=UPI0015E09310|nr:hypothetical protein [Bacillus sp. M6-12]